MQKKDMTYRAYLQREFSSRTRRNGSYSLRAFARDLAIPASKLSEVLSGRCGLSAKSASRIAGKLQLTPAETDLFVTLVECEHNRSQAGKTAARARLNALQAQDQFSELGLDRFRIISDWQHFAILELTHVADFQSDPKWIALKLGISETDAATAIARLLEFGLLERDHNGSLKDAQADLATPSGIPSRELREHHSQILHKADEALEKYPIQERDFSAITMAIDPEKMEEARNYLKEFRRMFCKDIQSSKNKRRVYCLGIQFFPMDQEILE